MIKMIFFVKSLTKCSEGGKAKDRRPPPLYAYVCHLVMVKIAPERPIQYTPPLDDAKAFLKTFVNCYKDKMLI